jgi:hypothetical protein
MFRIGAKVVYPGHGVGVIEGVQEKNIQGLERKFFMLRIMENGMLLRLASGPLLVGKWSVGCIGSCAPVNLLVI